MIMLQYHLIPTTTVGEEAFWRLWRHRYDVIVTWRHRQKVTYKVTTCTLSYRLLIGKNPLSQQLSQYLAGNVMNSWRHVMTSGVMTSGSTIRMDRLDARQRRPLC